MESWSTSSWFVVLSLAMGVGMWLISHTIFAWWRGGQVPKDMSRWVSELDFALRDLQGAEMQKAICYRRVADLLGEMPRDFDATALSGMVMSDQVGRAILERAEMLGIYPEGTFEKLGVVPFRKGVGTAHEAEQGARQELRETMLPPAGGNGRSPEPPWIGEWVEGRLVPPASRNLSEN